jgi:peptidylprolyl isomerase
MRRFVAVSAIAAIVAGCARHTPSNVSNGGSVAGAVVAGPSPSAKRIPPAQGKPVDAFTMRYIDIQEGTGALAEPGKRLTVHYTGWLDDGTEFDSSRGRNEPIVFELGARNLIFGWETGFDGMKVGGKRRLLIPWQMAYGVKGRGQIPPRANLTFDLELLAVDNLPGEADTIAAMRLFKENIDAIHKRDSGRYLATYLASNDLVRNAFDKLETGFEKWEARTKSEWPDTLVAMDLRVFPAGRGTVYGTYRYCVVTKGKGSTGVSERLFKKQMDGSWKIAVTTAFAAPPRPGDPPCPPAK